MADFARAECEELREESKATVPAAWIWHYADGLRSLRWKSSDVPLNTTPLYTAPTHAECMRLREENERLRRIEQVARLVVADTEGIRAWPKIIQLARALADTGAEGRE